VKRAFNISGREIVCFLLLAIIASGCQSLNAINITTTIPPNVDNIRDGSSLNKGGSVKIIGNNVNNSPTAYVTAVQDPSKKLWYLTTNLWAVQTAEGSVSMEYTGAGKLIINADLRIINGTFGGYPSIIYGRSPWSKTIASDQTAKFPMQIKQMQKLTCLTNYSLVFSKIGGNIAYDLWLTETQLPCDPSNGVEVMIWFFRNNNGPQGSFIGESIKEITINDIVTNRKFLVFVERKSPTRNWDVVTYMIDDQQAVPSGKIEIDLLDYVKSALVAIARSEELYLQGVEFGVEFTNQNQDFTFELNQFNIDQDLCP